MLKDTDKYSTKSHFSYDDYPKNQPKQNKDLMIFISVFIAGVLVILGFAKIMSPNVDVGISTNNEMNSQYEEEDESTSAVGIDDRLKNIKNEDDGNISANEDEMFDTKLEEKVVLPIQSKKTITPAEVKTEEVPQNNKIEQPVTTFAPVPGHVVKVYVGSYNTDYQAQEAKTMLHNSNNINAIIVKQGSTYTLQVGAYSSLDKAKQVTNDLLNNNIPARVVE